MGRLEGVVRDFRRSRIVVGDGLTASLNDAWPVGTGGDPCLGSKHGPNLDGRIYDLGPSIAIVGETDP